MTWVPAGTGIFTDVVPVMSEKVATVEVVPPPPEETGRMC